jgi:hypothetical protein
MNSIVKYGVVQLAVLFNSLLCIAAMPSKAAFAIDSSRNLASYYVAYRIPGDPYSPTPILPGLPPEVRVIGGGIDPPPIKTNAGTFYGVDRLLSVGSGVTALDGNYAVDGGLVVTDRYEGVCGFGFTFRITAVR